MGCVCPYEVVPGPASHDVGYEVGVGGCRCGGGRAKVVDTDEDSGMGLRFFWPALDLETVEVLQPSPVVGKLGDGMTAVRGWREGEVFVVVTSDDVDLLDGGEGACWVLARRSRLL